jgi:hypothetical protein
MNIEKNSCSVVTEQHVIFQCTHLHLTRSPSWKKADRSVIRCHYFLSRKGQTKMSTHSFTDETKF